jgi:hypothetical protein
MRQAVRQDGQNVTEQPDHSTSLGDTITASTGIRFLVHTAGSSVEAVDDGAVFL